MKYERLTEYEIPNCASVNGISPIDKDVANAINRLAELEDKIENGTLIDTEEYFIKEDEEWGSKNKFVICRHYVEIFIEDFCSTRAEAEKKLEELRNEEN